MKRMLYVILIICALLLAACGRSAEEPEEPPYEPIATPTPTPAPTPTPMPTPTPVPSPPPGMAISRLTGLYIREEAAARRPFAVVYNNETRAMPQAGLMQADIIYEVITEGNITRVVAIFQDFDAEMIGPIRSTRHYFTYFALDSNAVMVHHGGSTAGYNSIRNRGIPAIDGMRFDGSVFWRDAQRRQSRGLEHSSFTSAENLLNHVANFGIDMTISPDGNLGMFEFFDEPTAPRPENVANIVRVPHAGTNVSVFEYNPDTKLYYKFIFGEPQMDVLTDEQVAVTNVIVQIANISHIPGDTAGRRDVILVGSGRGYLATHGSFIPITWVKDSAESPTRWYDEDGMPLVINRGRTWISVIESEVNFE